ncbi:hypothetical protein [Methylorubrum extorquens]|jgi:hypothetical protein|uniref:Uncharacterized protein n=2 Tax=Methylorubrum extorquens TaxID=408 RepID=C5B5P4_METEA|nr:hypothetical protein [Methylorubrum extorquens]ACS43776.1 Hypothetical protein MexAM1_META2p0982 [Methylorubrum extorquens AM1]EHP94477.1 hypothetical protein MetexDRAFT_0676 [Methylorubrum extorquens DSM 13060]MCP1546384.1 hypothetical protein [Methylorubrum extorquens]MCP1591051.1 hypothetical protein [Methylorubrum extorquens]
MADQTPTLGELFKAKKVLDEEVVAAVDAYMADPTTGLFMIGEGYGVDLAAAVAANGWATERYNAKGATEAHRRHAVRTAILLARPTLR